MCRLSRYILSHTLNKKKLCYYYYFLCNQPEVTFLIITLCFNYYQSSSKPNMITLLERIPNPPLLVSK